MQLENCNVSLSVNVLVLGLVGCGFFNFYQIQNLLEMHLRRHAHCRVKLNRCFNTVRVTLKLRMVHVLSFLGVELGCFSFIPNEATSSAGFYEEKFSFELNRTCFMPTSQFLYCMSRVLRRKSFSISSTRGHNTLYHICMKTAFIVVLSF